MKISQFVDIRYIFTSHAEDGLIKIQVKLYLVQIAIGRNLVASGTQVTPEFAYSLKEINRFKA
jgi:hypothetical protein